MHYKIVIFLILIIYVPCNIVAQESINNSALQHLEDVPLNELNCKAKILGYWVIDESSMEPIIEDIINSMRIRCGGTIRDLKELKVYEENKVRHDTVIFYKNNVEVITYDYRSRIHPYTIHSRSSDEFIINIHGTKDNLLYKDGRLYNRAFHFPAHYYRKLDERETTIRKDFIAQYDKIPNPSSFIDIRFEYLSKASIKEAINLLKKQNDIATIKVPGTNHTALHRVVSRAPIIKFLLETGSNPHATTCDGSTPLHYAASAIAPESVKILLSHGAKANVVNKDGDTPLHNVISSTAGCTAESFKDSLDIVNTLLSNGADVNSRNSEGNMPLHLAATSGDPKIVKLLITNGANVNIANNEGLTPLHKAARNQKSFEIVKILITNEAEVNIVDKNGKTPLHYSAKYNSLNTNRLLVSNGADLNIPCNEGNTPLHEAWYNKPEIIAFLISKGADVNVTNNYGKTPLHFAVDNNSPEKVKILISNGAKTGIKDKNGDSPITENGMYHLSEYNPEKSLLVLETLLAAGADPNEKNNYFDTPLSLAVNCNWTAGVKLLINNNADVNQTNKDGESLIVDAIRRSSKELIQSLIDANAKDNKGRSFDDLARKYNRKDLIDSFNHRDRK